jgi:toxin YoeB
MEIVYQIIYFKEARNDIDYWKKSGDKQAIKKIDKILDTFESGPYSKSPGEPEKLKYTDAYSRRINKKDRITTK